ncbi:iron uptake system protein EfeO [Aureimonas phyllosphaerae]|uniref:iron uptake system protein EfeO n=1 Tax=Aureimonas phyllosphaerae TaxID=1166078 RepID=UPI003A5BC1A3
MTAVSPAPASRRALRWGAVASAGLMVAGLGAFAYASQVAARRAPGGDAVTVTLRGDACQPNALTVTAGRVSFRIVNETERAVEWEILDGVMVVEERENIAPGLSQTLGARLKPGEYAITCGLLSNPRGRLVVLPSGNGAPVEAPRLVAFVGPLAEYQVFTQMQARDLQRAVAALDAAVQAGDLAKARELYSQARAPFERIAPVAERIGDLADRIDPVAAYLAAREADGGFTGFHRLEYGLFAKNSLAGLEPVSKQLVADVGALRERLRALKTGPADMTDGAARALRSLADTTDGGGENVYARTDVADIAARVAGVEKIAALLKPVAVDAAPAPFGAVEAQLQTLKTDVAAIAGTGAAPSFDAVPAAALAKLATDARALAEAIETLGGAIGLGQDDA